MSPSLWHSFGKKRMENFMENLYNETKNIMKKYNISANKKLGQNFLIDRNVVEGIVETADLFMVRVLSSFM